MKKSFLFLAVVALLSAGCSKTNDNANNSNAANAPIAATSPETAQTNTNTTVTSEPVPVFTDAQTALTEGNKYFEVSATEKAIEAYKQAIKLDPELAEAYFKLGVSYSLQESEREAAQIDSQVETTETPAPAKAKKDKKGKEIVKLTESEKAFESAIKAYEKVIKKNPKDDVAFFNTGRSYNKLNKDEEAAKAFKEAVKIKPDDTEYQTEYGAILVKLANYDDAIPVLKKAIALDDSNSQAQELLEKAEAGKKRIDFGVKAKTQEAATKSKQGQGKSKAGDADADDDTPPPLSPLTAPTTAPKPATTPKKELD